jgi:hypothetical protein
MSGEQYFRYYSSEEQVCWRLFQILLIRRTSLLKVISDIIHQKNKFVEGYFRYYSSEEQVCWRLFQILFIRRTSLLKVIWRLFQKRVVRTKLDIIFMFWFKSLGGYFCLWTIISRGYHPPSSRCDMFNTIYLLFIFTILKYCNYY